MLRVRPVRAGASLALAGALGTGLWLHHPFDSRLREAVLAVGTEVSEELDATTPEVSRPVSRVEPGCVPWWTRRGWQGENLVFESFWFPGSTVADGDAVARHFTQAGWQVHRGGEPGFVLATKGRSRSASWQLQEPPIGVDDGLDGVLTVAVGPCADRSGVHRYTREELSTG